MLDAHFNGKDADRINVPLRESAFQEGIEQGYWNDTGSPTAKGEPFFIAANSEEQTFALTKSLTYKVDVTGLSDGNDGQATKLVEFRVSTEGLRGPPRRFAVPFGTARAEFRRFDDGWRLENPDNLTLNYERVRQLQLSQKEQNAIAFDMADAAQAKTERMLEAQKDTEEHVFECAVSHANNVKRRRLKITNANIYVSDMQGGPDKVIWFGNLQRWYAETIPFQTILVAIDDSGNRAVLYFTPCRDYGAAADTLNAQFEAWKSRFPDQT